MRHASPLPMTMMALLALVPAPASPFSTPRSICSAARATRAAALQSGPLPAASADDDAENDAFFASSELLDALGEEERRPADAPAPSQRDLALLLEEIEEKQEGSSDGGGGSEETDVFAPLLGLYSVAAVLPAKPGENPVGGKWTRKGGLARRLLRNRATYQHVVRCDGDGGGAADAVAQAVNVISLEALFGLVRLTIILRGDAVPLTTEERVRAEQDAAAKAKERGEDNPVGALSPRLVRAVFDPPRIVFGRRGRILNLSVGPPSSVLLDTTYCDEAIRVGKGGTSGTKFVFRRVVGKDAEEPGGMANEWRPLLERRPLRRSKALLVLGSILGWGIQMAARDGARLIGLSVSALSSLLGAVILFGSGGIEDEGRIDKKREAASA